MFSTIRNAFKNPDLRKKIIYTLFVFLIFRMGTAIYVPFIDATAIKELFSAQDSAFGLLNMFSGGAFSTASIFALSITPYITAQIIIQLLTVAIPPLERMAREGETGRKKLDKITRVSSMFMAAAQGFGYYTIVRAQGAIKNYSEYGTLEHVFIATVIVASFTAGAFVVVWLGDRITEKGIGNGISMILFAGILSGLPDGIMVLWESFSQGGINYILVPIILVIFCAMIVFIILMTEAERRIPVQYAKRVVGRKMYGGQSSYIPIKVNMSGVLPIIFASSLLSLPGTIISLFNPQEGFWLSVRQFLSPSNIFYGVLYALLIFGFNYFYVAMQYNPIQIANDIKSNNGAIPGIRPGKPTSTYISKVISRITFFGAIFLAIIAVFPIVFTAVSNIQVSLGGTSIIIVVGVALDTVRSLESQLMMRHHKGFLE